MAMSGGSLSSPMSAAKYGFSLPTAKKALMVGAGMIGNAWLSGFVGGFLPSVVSSTPFNYVLGLGTAGLLGLGTAMISRSAAIPVAFGGVVQVVVDAMRQYVLPLVAPYIPGMHGMMGLDDYLTPMNAANARPLGYMGDYLTPMNAAQARPLGDMNDAYFTEELAGL
ncbi:MAG: hypothetical protein GZ088_09685 [Acidipila sp.]|nr:hypothetical protein [Acidipila sp.]